VMVVVVVVIVHFPKAQGACLGKTHEGCFMKYSLPL
jgi:hypothetical protein